ncbi:uncharacterized protein LOC8036600 [Ixodes scapularis]|uniref:uncharacterized protein LOC8036600 n=1 Tax=Ixodes scapularis TaxID=6945 RepID=UPI001A9F937F|nr:uncharacterized protein LOC8036600 [Ixodes scapularis]
MPYEGQFAAMHSRLLAKTFTALLVLSSICGICSGKTPTATFNEEIQSTPILLYQCYRNGTTVEPKDAVNYTALFDGTTPNDAASKGNVWFAMNGTEDKYTELAFTATYDSKSDMISLVASGSSTDEKIRLVESPFRGKAYFVNEMYDGQPASKIYDVDKTCVNAAANLQEACPDGCGMRLVREVGAVEQSGGITDVITSSARELFCRTFTFLC